MDVDVYEVDKALNKQIENVTTHSFPSPGACSKDVYTVAMMTKMEAMHGINCMIFLQQN